MMDYKRKDIILVNLYPKKGDEIGKVRPAVIVSDDIDNSELDTLIVMPLSSQLIDDVSPYRVRLIKREGLNRDSDVLVHQIRTISKARVIENIAKVTEDEYTIIKSSLCQIV